jgi:hypothetical protein
MGKIKKNCQLTAVMHCSLFYLYMIIWRCQPWFSSAQSSSEQSSLAQKEKSSSCIQVNKVYAGAVRIFNIAKQLILILHRALHTSA